VRELRVFQVGQDFDAPQRTGLDADAGSGVRDGGEFQAEMIFEFGDFRRPLPIAGAARKDPGVRDDAFVVDPVNQDRQLDGAVG